jgi:hypothetical protein
MKKYALLFFTLFNFSLFAQTEYIELSSNKLFNRSYVTYYNDSPSAFEDDLEISVVKGDFVYHWVTYSGVKKVQLICADPENTLRKICVNGDCNIYDTYNQVYNFNLNRKIDSISIYKPNYEIDNYEKLVVNLHLDDD